MERREITGSISYSMNCSEGERRLVGFALGIVDPESILIQETEGPINDPTLPDYLKRGRTIVTLDCVDDAILLEFNRTLANLRTRYRRIGP